MFWWILTVVICLTGGIRGANVKRATTCIVNGKTIQDGEKFTVPGSCNEYTCTAGGYTTSSYSCPRNGQCMPEGDTYNHGCTTLTCQRSNGKFGYMITSEGCRFKDTCLGVGQTKNDGCFVYECRKTTSGYTRTYTLSLKDWGCARDSKCHPPNSVITDQCQTLTCQNIGGSVGFRNTEPGCSLRGKCLKLGETTQEDCVTYKCQAQNILGTNWYKADRISTKCKDAYGNCREPGSTFPYSINGQIRDKCTCTTEGSMIRYSCS